jgi:hypothetical protein
MSESLATLHETPSKLSVESATHKEPSSAKEEAIPEHPEMEDDEGTGVYGIVKEEVPMSVPQEVGNPGREVSGGSTEPAPAPTAKAFLGKGKIDAKAQDDFIAFMLGMK